MSGVPLIGSPDLFIGSIIGGVISSVAFSVIWRWWHQPKLRFDIPEENEPAINDAGLAFYHIRVTNVGRGTAHDCRLSIEYKNADLELIVRLNPGKWDSNPDPVSPFVSQLPNGAFQIVDVPNRSLSHYSGRISISPNSSETFCFLIKYAGEEECYGFNANNFIDGFPMLRVNDRILALGEFIITCNVTTEKTDAEMNLLVTNGERTHADVTIQEKRGIFPAL
jgi:hypothetical protein